MAINIAAIPLALFVLCYLTTSSRVVPRGYENCRDGRHCAFLPVSLIFLAVLTFFQQAWALVSKTGSNVITLASLCVGVIVSILLALLSSLWILALFSRGEGLCR